jgi:hypothetical protein
VSAQHWASTWQTYSVAEKGKGEMTIKMLIARHGMRAYIFFGKLSKSKGAK